MKQKVTAKRVTVSQQDSGQILQKKEIIKRSKSTFTSNDVLAGNMKRENKKPADQISSRVVLQESLPQDIGDLIINGIIYFGTDNPLNYALASYKGKDQMKLTTGDRLKEVQILEIQPEKIVFIFQDKIFEKKLGN
jgi:hypothetical protein